MEKNCQKKKTVRKKIIGKKLCQKKIIRNFFYQKVVGVTSVT